MSAPLPVSLLPVNNASAIAAASSWLAKQAAAAIAGEQGGDVTQRRACIDKESAFTAASAWLAKQAAATVAGEEGGDVYQREGGVCVGLAWRSTQRKAWLA